MDYLLTFHIIMEHVQSWLKLDVLLQTVISLGGSLPTSMLKRASPLDSKNLTNNVQYLYPE